MVADCQQHPFKKKFVDIFYHCIFLKIVQRRCNFIIVRKIKFALTSKIMGGLYILDIGGGEDFRFF
jgi:hypothetical protein